MNLNYNPWKIKFSSSSSSSSSLTHTHTHTTHTHTHTPPPPPPPPPRAGRPRKPTSLTIRTFSAAVKATLPERNRLQSYCYYSYSVRSTSAVRLLSSNSHTTVFLDQPALSVAWPRLGGGRGWWRWVWREGGGAERGRGVTSE